MISKYLLLVPAIICSFSLPAYSSKNCVPQNGDTLKSNFVSAEDFGSVGFSQSKNPARLTRTSGVSCFKLDSKKRVYFFINHKGQFKNPETEFIAVQIVKKFINDDRHQFIHTSHGLRKGKWTRDGKSLSEIQTLRHFGNMTAYEFLQLHGSPENRTQDGILKDDVLVRKFRNRYWHATPVDGETSSLELPDYWNSKVESDQNIQVENLLLRFTTVPFDQDPAKYKNGIRFNTGTPDGLLAMEVRIHSPVSKQFTHRIRLQLD